jgi:hypothetical protein
VRTFELVCADDQDAILTATNLRGVEAVEIEMWERTRLATGAAGPESGDHLEKSRPTDHPDLDEHRFHCDREGRYQVVNRDVFKILRVFQAKKPRTRGGARSSESSTNADWRFAPGLKTQKSSSQFLPSSIETGVVGDGSVPEPVTTGSLPTG